MIKTRKMRQKYNEEPNKELFLVKEGELKQKNP